MPASVDTVAQLGVATGADSTNKLAVASEASLFSHAGAGHQMKVNKAADAETHLPSGFYSGSGSSADVTIFPSSGYCYKPFLNTTRRVTNGAFEQLRLFFDSNTMYLRTANTAGEWSTPLSFFTPANVVGPVSQSGGVSTGAVIEAGETADGHYVRFADGTKIG